MTQVHWEFDSECPHCGKINHVRSPEGERVVAVHCEHCPHSYEYVHVIQEHEVIELPSDVLNV